MAENIAVRKLVAAELDVAAAVLGRGMRDNPAHIEVFGDDETHRQQALTAMFAGLFRADRDRRVYGALQGARLIGVLAVAPPSSCRLNPIQRGRVAARLLPWGRTAIARAARWQSAWSAADPRNEHVHLGPVAVDRDLQGRGIGSLLLGEHVAELDRQRVRGYLETDKEQNVGWYQRFGYRVTGEVRPFDAPHWLMTRSPQDR